MSGSGQSATWWPKTETTAMNSETDMPSSIQRRGFNFPVRPVTVQLSWDRSGQQRQGRACALCPGILDVNLLRYCEGIIYFDAEIPDRAFDLGMPQQELNSPKIAGPPVDQGSFCASQQVCPNNLGSRPTPRIHSDTRRAYWRVVRPAFASRRPVNNCPGFLLEAFR